MQCDSHQNAANILFKVVNILLIISKKMQLFLKSVLCSTWKTKVFINLPWKSYNCKFWSESNLQALKDFSPGNSDCVFITAQIEQIGPHDISIKRNLSDAFLHPKPCPHTNFRPKKFPQHEIDPFYTNCKICILTNFFAVLLECVSYFLQ